MQKEMRFIRSAPHLPVKNLRETLNYYRDVLGFYDEWTFGEKDGGIRKDEMRLLFAEDPEFVSSINSGRQHFPLIWFVRNIDKIYQEFSDRKIAFSSQLQVHPYQMREFAFIDINGYYIRVSERIEEDGGD
jgi:glyoxalase/bleomycin resistance protein/dioxygenase superfamily protein